MPPSVMVNTPLPTPRAPHGKRTMEDMKAAKEDAREIGLANSFR